MRNERERSFTEQIDSQNTIIGRVVFTEDYAAFEAFSISLLSNIGKKPVEIIRFDGSWKEKVNVHRFYSNPPTKHYMEKEKTFETLDEFRKNIKNNWLQYVLKYKENYMINENYI